MSWFSEKIRTRDLPREARTDVAIHMLQTETSKLNAFMNGVDFCDEENCGAMYRLQDLQAVERIEQFNDLRGTGANVRQSIVHFCREHRRPYDRIEQTYSPCVFGDSTTRYIKEMGDVEVDEKGKIIHKK